MKNVLRKNQLMITALAIMIAIAGYLQYAEKTMPGETKDGAKTVNSGNVITENYTLSDTGMIDGILDLSEEDLLALRSENEDMQAYYKDGDLLSLDGDWNIVMEDYLEDGMDEIVANFSKGDTNAGEEPASAIPDQGEIPGEAVLTSAGAAVLSDAKLLKEQTRARNKATLMEIIDNATLSEEQKQQAVNNMVEMTQIAEKEAAAEILLEAKGFSDVVVSLSGTGADVVVNAVSLSDAQRAQIEDIVRRKTGASPDQIIISTVVKD